MTINRAVVQRNSGNVLWWGRHDSDYSRNRMVWSIFESLGWSNYEFKPLSSYFAYMESFVRNIPKPDLVWVASFRQRDVNDAIMKARDWNVPLIFDPLISSYEKDVFERKKWPEWHRKSLKSKKNEARLFSRANLVVADTDVHASFFQNILGVDPRKIRTVYVGAEENIFNPDSFERQLSSNNLEILFYGSFLELHGVDIIAEAAKMTSDLNVRWVMLGDGPCKADLIAAQCASIIFEDPVPYEKLPQRIAQADIVLGVFGATKKSGMVIPNKIFQAMSMAKPVITQQAMSYPQKLRESDVIGWVEPGSAVSLANKVRAWVQDPAVLQEKGRNTRILYKEFFSRSIIEKQLSDAIFTAISNMQKGL